MKKYVILGSLAILSVITGFVVYKLVFDDADELYDFDDFGTVGD